MSDLSPKDDEQKLYGRMDEACEKLLDRLFPATIDTGGQSQAPQVIDVKETVMALRFVKDYLEMRYPRGVNDPPPKSRIGAWREQLNGGKAADRGGATPPKIGNRKQPATVRIGVRRTDGDDGDDGPVN